MNQSDLAHLRSREVELRRNLDNLKAMAEQGIPVEEAITYVKQELMELEKKLATIQGPQTLATFDQQSQRVNTQYNIANIIQQSTVASSVAGPDALKRYLQRLQHQCQVLPMVTLGGEEGVDDDLTLDRIYIELDTTTRVPMTSPEKENHQKVGAGLEHANERPLSALEAVTQTPRLALLGDPGAGKSTFAHRLISWLAAALLKETEPPPGLSTDLLPVFITLRDLSPRLIGLDIDQLSDQRRREALAQAVCEHVVDNLTQLDAEEFADMLREAFIDGRCLLVLDGLDEVPYKVTHLVRQATVAVISQYGAQRIILTCRVRSYVDEMVFPGFKVYTLAPFDAYKIRGFARAWYMAQKEAGRIDASEAKSKADNLTQAALLNELYELATNPMILTTMAIIHQREIGLPQERVRLYSLIVDVLLHRWQKHKTGTKAMATSPALAEVLNNYLWLREVMEGLAYEAHQTSREKVQAGDLSRGEILALLEQPKYLGDTGLAAEFLDYVDQRAGILVGRGGTLGRPPRYSFPHRTFQEYLAGCFLVNQRHAARALYTRAGEGDKWTLVAQLGAEELLLNQRRPHELLDLMYRLCPAGVMPTTAQARRAALWAGHIATILGSHTIVHDTGGAESGPTYMKHVLTTQLDLLESDLTALERAEVGRNLAYLDDPRPGVGLRDGLPDIVWCEVPAGPFIMGSDRSRNQHAQDDELPAHSVDLSTFRISRYPVTNTQYNCFVESGGYSSAEYWMEAIQAGFWRDGRIKRVAVLWLGGGKMEYREEWGTAPATFSRIVFNLPNHPVVGISWHEALAFCRWLTVKLRQRRKLALDEMVILPSEAQWEKAARGSDGRIYPWGDEFSSNRANIFETGLGYTGAVGCFLNGVSPYGCMDMIGSMWEWTRSLWGSRTVETVKVEFPFQEVKFEFHYPYDPADGRESLATTHNELRVSRGGSWNSNRRNAHCAYRLRDIPYFVYNNVGFRLVAVPISQIAGLPVNSG